jgi:hypothetical protein
MCFYISIAVSENSLLEVPRLLPTGVHVSTVNGVAPSWCPPQHIAVHLITETCSCQLYHRVDDEEPAAEPVDERLRRKYMRQGWSATKIDRAIQQAMAHHNDNSFIGLRQDICVAISEISQRCGEHRLFVHMYSGSEPLASLSPRAHRRIEAPDLGCWAVRIEEDVLYTVDPIEEQHSRSQRW